MQIKKDERNEIKHITFKIPLSVLSQKRDLWAVEKTYRRNTADIVQAKERGNTGGRGVRKPHASAGEYFTVPACSTVHGISQGKEQLNDLRQAREFEVQVWVEEFSVQRILCGYCGAQ